MHPLTIAYLLVWAAVTGNLYGQFHTDNVRLTAALKAACLAVLWPLHVSWMVWMKLIGWLVDK